MIKNNTDVARAASEAYHQLTQTGEIDVNGAKARAALLTVMQRSYMIDAVKRKLGVDFLQSEQASESGEKMFVKTIK